MRKWIFSMLCMLSSLSHAAVDMVVRPIPLSFPEPTLNDLNRGYLAMGALRTTQGMVIRVRSDSTQPWRLVMRARNDRFQPQSLRKLAADVKWKLNEDDQNQYRDLTLQDQLIYVARNGGDQDVRVDFVLKTTWADPPAAYQLDILFSVREE